MKKITISEILDDLRVASEVLRKFERRYWITSEQFYELYSKGLLDHGENSEDFSEWAGFYKLKVRREQAFKELSTRRVEKLKQKKAEGAILLDPQELEYDIA